MGPNHLLASEEFIFRTLKREREREREKPPTLFALLKRDFCNTEMTIMAL